MYFWNEYIIYYFHFASKKMEIIYAITKIMKTVLYYKIHSMYEQLVKSVW